MIEPEWHPIQTARWALACELLTEIMQQHADPNDPAYNECDTDPCMWCAQAQKAMGKEPI